MNSRLLRHLLLISVPLLTLACAVDTQTDADAGPGADADAGSNEDADGGTEDAGQVESDAGVDAGTEPSDAGVDAGSVCEPFGRFGVPTNTFTLPGPNANGRMYYPNIQTAFPQVDWATLDRLYIPAATYEFINIGNLPSRSADRPLVITNLGGQVVLRPPPSGTAYVWSMNGGKNWIITGRYDPDSQTGHVDFQGHRCGQYANSGGTYGILSDDLFVPGHMGLGIGNASEFEVEYVEIMRSGFAGLRVNNGQLPDGGVAPIVDAKLHDLYIHDTDSEGIYFGSTQAPPTPLAIGLQIYNNRIVRTGTEALQVQNLGDGTEIHHNVMAFGAIDWRAAFQQFQDNNSQVQVRSGTIRLHHNVFLGAAANFVNFASGPEAGDGARNVEFSDNYFADTLNGGIYFGGTSEPADGGADSSYRFVDNAWRGFEFRYDEVYPTRTDPGVIFRLGNNFESSITIENNEWEGSRAWVVGLDGGTGTVGNVTAIGNVNGPVPAFEFVDTGLPSGTATRDLEMWASRATLAPNDPLITYPVGQLVMHEGELYVALVQNTDVEPGTDATVWSLLPFPVDDLRTKRGTVWHQRGIGLLDQAP